MASRKIRAGISFDDDLVKLLNVHAEKLAELNVDRSEIVNAILDDYFVGNGTTESLWGVVTKRRIRRRNGT